MSRNGEMEMPTPCPGCNDIVELNDLCWTFSHCGHYWIVQYDRDKQIHMIYDSVTGATCYRCKGTNKYGFLDVTGEYEVMPCGITLPALPSPLNN